MKIRAVGIARIRYFQTNGSRIYPQPVAKIHYAAFGWALLRVIFPRKVQARLRRYRDERMSGDTFYFVRHGEADYDLRGVRCGGDRDVPLTRRGAGGGIGWIVTSPLLRTQRTAAIIASALGGVYGYLRKGKSRRDVTKRAMQGI